MRKESVKATLTIIAAVLFNIVFWREKIGLNALLFAIFITGSIIYLYPRSAKTAICRWLLAANIVTAVTVMVHNSLLGKMAFSTSMLLFISFSKYQHRSPWYAGGSTFLSYLYAIPNLTRALITAKGKRSGRAVIKKPSGIVVVPLLIVTPFIIIYAFANTMFLDIATSMATSVQDWFRHFFDWLSVNRLLFFVAGLFISCGLVFAARSNWFSDADMKKNDHLLRSKVNLIKWKQSAFADLFSVITGKPAAGTMAIKNERTIGLMSLAFLNLLLVVINVIDIKYVWADFTVSSHGNIASYVHQGAGLLILSIILAMLVLLFFFRGNLNFYTKNNKLKYGAYCWIFQNCILVISVCIRNYYYISHFGLTYKRIGLLFFLALVVSGLLTVFIKIYFTRSIYYLLKINAWAATFILVLASTINWDVVIASYNLGRKSSIPVDVPFLLSLSDSTLPLIANNADVLQNHTIGRSTAPDFFEYRKRSFLNEQSTYSWLSWNMADQHTIRALTSPSSMSLK